MAYSTKLLMLICLLCRIFYQFGNFFFSKFFISEDLLLSLPFLILGIITIQCTDSQVHSEESGMHFVEIKQLTAESPEPINH